MDEKRVSQSEIENLRGLLAGLAFETKLIRLRRRLVRDGRAIKGWEDQPRAPSGRSDGGQWTRGPGGQGASLQQDGSAATSTESTTLEDGTRVLSIRIHAGPRAFDQQHTVVSPDGDSRVFETIGATQTIRDGETGEMLSRATFTPSALVPEPVVRPAFLPALPLVAAEIAVTFELGLALFGYLSGREDGYGTVLGMTAQQYGTGKATQPDVPVWVGRLSQAELDATCPRNGQVQAIADEVSAQVRASGAYANASELGTRIHVKIAAAIKQLKDPKLIAELFLGETTADGTKIVAGSKRADALEDADQATACIYDFKTGRQGLTPRRALALIRAAQIRFSGKSRFIMIQVRPK